MMEQKYPGVIFQTFIWGSDEETAQHLRALVDIPEDPGSSPRTHMTDHNHL